LELHCLDTQSFETLRQDGVQKTCESLSSRKRQRHITRVCRSAFDGASAHCVRKHSRPLVRCRDQSLARRFRKLIPDAFPVFRSSVFLKKPVVQTPAVVPVSDLASEQTSIMIEIVYGIAVVRK